MIIITIFVFSIFFLEIFYSEFRKKRTTSLTMEINWIIFPLVILFFIGLPSIGILYELEDSDGKENNISIKTTGFQ